MTKTKILPAKSELLSQNEIGAELGAPEQTVEGVETYVEIVCEEQRRYVPISSEEISSKN